jgi:hypothetical protein
MPSLGCGDLNTFYETLFFFFKAQATVPCLVFKVDAEMQNHFFFSQGKFHVASTMFIVSTFFS